jgi:FtsH-binding integral membrane protein
MKKPNQQDELVAAQRRKIASDAYGILMIALLASVLVQQFLLNAPFEQYAVEAICFFGMSAYIIVRYVTLGIDLYGNKNRAKVTPFLNSIVAGGVITAVNGVLNYSKYGEHYQEDGIGPFVAVLAITFISVSIFVFLMFSLINYLNKKRQAQIQKRLDEEEQGE